MLSRRLVTNPPLLSALLQFSCCKGTVLHEENPGGRRGIKCLGRRSRLCRTTNRRFCAIGGRRHIRSVFELLLQHLVCKGMVLVQ